jgi:hypothetical protein
MRIMGETGNGDRLRERALVIPINDASAARHVGRWHYSKHMPRGRNISYGWYVGWRLYAVAVYGNGVNPQQERFLSRMSGLQVSGLVELKRLARCDPKLNLPLTAFLAQSHRLLRRQHNVRWVVSFSDPAHGHTGGIYRAANFFSFGKTKAEYHTVDRDGNTVHRRRAYRLAKRCDLSIAEARERLDLRCVRTLPKDRWLLPLEKKSRRSIERNFAEIQARLAKY